MPAGYGDTASSARTPPRLQELFIPNADDPCRNRDSSSGQDSNFGSSSGRGTDDGRRRIDHGMGWKRNAQRMVDLSEHLFSINHTSVRPSSTTAHRTMVLFSKLLPFLGLQVAAFALDSTRSAYAHLSKGAWQKKARGYIDKVEEPANPARSWRNWLRGRRQKFIHVPTYVTVVVDYNETMDFPWRSRERGYIPEESITKQMEMLNDAYRPGGFHFTLQNLIYSRQPAWYTDPAIDKVARRESLQLIMHKGDYKTLNLIFINDILRDKGVVGETYLPNWKIDDDPWFYMDGPIMTSACAPELGKEGWTSSSAAIHEVGHWLGLRHPNETKCAQRKMEYCALGRPTVEGTDVGEAWSNFMFPVSTFTTGQFDEMRRNWHDYRLQDLQIKNQILSSAAQAPPTPSMAPTTTPTPTLAEKLDKIKSPGLQSQQRTVVILQAVESTLREQNAAPTPTAYLASLLSLLQEADKGDKIDSALATPAVYLLDVITPYAPQPLLRSKFTQILTLLAPLLLNQDAEPILLRSSIGCLEALLLAQDGSSWELSISQIGPRRAVAGLLNLALDHRPKVRRRAQDALKKVLRNPPPSPSLDHPAADMCAQTALKNLEDLAGEATHSRKSNMSAKEPALIHALQLVKTVAAASGGWPSTRIESLCELLLNIAKTGNEYMTMAGFDIFELIFKGMSEEASSARLPRLMEIISELRPAANDTQLVPPWLAIVSRGYDVSSQLEPRDTFEKLPDLFALVAQFLESESENIRISASECMISFIANCIPDQVVLNPSIYDEKMLDKLVSIAQSLLTVQYQAAWLQTFDVLGAMFMALRWRSYPRMLTITKTIGEIREKSAFRNKKEADQVIGQAIRAMGPEAVLTALPLNIAKSVKGQPGRAWMFPILRDYTSNTRLAHFKSEMVPLSGLLFQKVLDHGEAEKTMEVKIYETLVQQTWSILVGYCDLPLDLGDAFDQPFAEMLSNLLYQQVYLRPEICKALKTLVESNQAIANTADDEDDLLLYARVSRETARKNLTHIGQLAANLLAVLFNVYTQTLPQSRGPMLQTINALLSTAPQHEVMQTFGRVSEMLASELQTASSSEDKSKKQKKDAMPSTAQTLMDLVITMSAYLPRESFAALFEIASVIAHKEGEPQLQKKAYKLIPRLAGSELGRAALQERNAELQQLILSSSQKVSTPARRERLAAVLALLPSIPDESLHFLPSVLSEVVICCKESNERAREMAYELLVQMGHRMASADGAIIDNSRIPHMASGAPPGKASIEEYLTMVSAGLAGSTPHMISASITAISRLLFEFRSSLSEQTLSDLVQTMDLFLTSNNREIVKSCLGFVKVCVISLPVELMMARLKTLVPNLLVWSHEHKGHFKAKVKHILERMVRRFGYDVVYKNCPEADKKLMMNIRKTKDRAKRKRDASRRGGDDDDDDDDGESTDDDNEGKGRSKTKQFENEYDQALYSSDSDDDADADMGKTGGKKSRKGGKAYIVEEGDEPLDLLDKSALANVSSTKPVRLRTTSSRSKATRLDPDGKLIVGGGGEEDDEAMDVDAHEEGAGVGAYVAAIRSRDAAKRGRGGKLRFSNRSAAQGRADDEMPDAAPVEDAAVKKAVVGLGGRGRPSRRGGNVGGVAARSGKGAIAAGRRGLGQPKSRGPSGGRRDDVSSSPCQWPFRHVIETSQINVICSQRGSLPNEDAVIVNVLTRLLVVTIVSVARPDLLKP
ncbi:hypothetical protein L249_3281 [Ophiocordyceps polyrhachis-furcata BCC 54312]|uniref:Uncharacterized protein n=1 Tax=Ophiocordyceps polyrhachis-furcata BCC 54312 TaxID=1330021 RepID=A0A367LN51_9HYPO|nr:hypothetical protein L249_3281 [Ophiocordyceps polyrhachis-furcata BCC 54312]